VVSGRHTARLQSTALAVQEEERAQVFGLCVHLAGNPDVAEDLTQETLFEAWRHGHRLRDPAKRLPWVLGIARNLCRRWARQRGKDLARLTPLGERGEDTLSWNASGSGRARGTVLVEDWPDEDFDVEVELERRELADLLDRALARLPAGTRALLVARLVEQRPQREVAERLGLNEATVAVKLQRGKLYLRRLLTTHLAAEAATYGLIGSQDEWHPTRIWCPECGRVHLSVMAGPMRCPACDQRVEVQIDPQRLTVRGGCARCGPQLRWGYGAQEIVRSLPEAQAFWRRHPRLRTLPPVELESHGCDAVLISLQSMRGAARLDVLLARKNLAVLGIYGELQDHAAGYRDG
jgi:RNA polymerase sigma factor (sigma-70 family)